MKPIKLLIKGLQSFEEEQEIDFQKLSEHGLFGIFGPTGSGKSTILDAITLAIYGDIVRIKGSQADRLEHLVNMNCNEMRVDFTFELGSHVFQIIREMKLKKTERVFSSKKQYLLKDGEIIADKDTQIKSEIDNYIGLSMDDFTRSVVLPQGKFSEFLKLSGTDRRDMLERLFGLQKYGKQMLDKIRKKLAIYQDNISAIDNQILGKGNFSEDELEKNKEILNNLKSEKIQVENFLKTKTDEFKIKENFWNLQKELETLKIEEKRILENKETVKDYKSKIELDIKAKEINAVYENYNSLTKKVEEKEKISINIKNDNKVIENRLKEEKNNLEILKNSIVSLEKEKDSNVVTMIERAKSQEFLNKKNEYQDEGLKGNERIEDAIFALQKEATQEQLAHTLTVIRRRMKEGGQLIVAVEPDPAQAQMKLQTVRTPDGKIWWSAFTSFEEELKGADQVKSTFLSEIGRMFEAALTVPEIAGIIINPWNRTIMLDKHLIRIIMPD